MEQRDGDKMTEVFESTKSKIREHLGDTSQFSMKIAKQVSQRSKKKTKEMGEMLTESTKLGKQIAKENGENLINLLGVMLLI